MARTADPNEPKGYSISWNVMLSIETRELAGRGGSLHGHRSAGGEQLHCASLVFSWALFIYFYFILLYSFSLLLLLIVIVVILFYFSY